jgi:hypothetical protein
MEVVVVGGEAVVGQALELLLGGAGHAVSFVSEHLSDEPELLRDAGLLVLAPGLDDRRRESLLAQARGTQAGASAARVPVLELVPYLLGAAFEGGRLAVPWPCRAEELERYVAKALASGGAAEEEDVEARLAAPSAFGKEEGE